MNKNSRIVAATLEFAHEDPIKSWYYFSITLGLVIIAFGGTVAVSNPAGRMLSAIFAGLLMCRLFVLYHDFQHEAILRKSFAAKILMRIIGLLTLAPESIWKETHQHHHTHNAKFAGVVMGSFPTITTQTFRTYNKPQRFWYLLIRHPLIILFSYVPVFLVSLCLWPFFENPRKYYDCGLAVLVHALILMGLYISGGWERIFFSLLLPSLITFAVGGYIFYAQHNFPGVKLRANDEWDYLEAALYSSSYIKMNKVMSWFTGNIGYHHIHHVNSRIPFYRLPEAMEHVTELHHNGSTTLRPADVISCLRLKLWDAGQDRMITLKEFYAHE